MPLTVTEGTLRSEEPRFLLPVSVAFDTSYAAGGEPLDYEALDAWPDNAVLLGTMDEAGATHHFRFDKTNKTLHAYVNATGAEVAGTTNLVAETDVEVTFIAY